MANRQTCCNLFVSILLLLGNLSWVAAQNKAKQGQLIIELKHIANNQPLQLQQTYQNNLSQTYRLTKFKYYISNLAFENLQTKKVYKKQVWLVDQQDSNTLSIRLSLPVGTYNHLQALLGVDSAKNCSGVQTGALDPLNDMFWTWNSGYILEKLEGYADSSSAFNNKIEYHLGGFRSPYVAMQTINLNLPRSGIKIDANSTTRLQVEMNLDLFWAYSSIDFKEIPVCAQPGKNAVLFSLAFAKMINASKINLIQQP
ncbi:MAG: hypothetical protein RLY16_93 [Bacteroidota bacterium]